MNRKNVLRLCVTTCGFAALAALCGAPGQDRGAAGAPRAHDPGAAECLFPAPTRRAAARRPAAVPVPRRHPCRRIAQRHSANPVAFVCTFRAAPFEGSRDPATRRDSADPTSRGYSTRVAGPLRIRLACRPVMASSVENRRVGCPCTRNAIRHCDDISWDRFAPNKFGALPFVGGRLPTG